MLSEVAAHLVLPCCVIRFRVLYPNAVPRAEDSAKIQFAGHSCADSILRGIVGSEVRILHQ